MNWYMITLGVNRGEPGPVGASNHRKKFNSVFHFQVELMCCYLFELSLTEISAVGVAASTRCAAAVRLIRQLLKAERERITSSPNTSMLDADSLERGLDPWNDRMVRILGHDDSAYLRSVALIYVGALKRFQPGALARKERFEVSLTKLWKLDWLIFDSVQVIFTVHILLQLCEFYFCSLYYTSSVIRMRNPVNSQCCKKASRWFTSLPSIKASHRS